MQGSNLDEQKDGLAKVDLATGDLPMQEYEAIFKNRPVIIVAYNDEIYYGV
jgi:hypothetical protein